MLHIFSFPRTAYELMLLRGTQPVVSLNYPFRRSLIPSDFLERIVTLNFRAMRNLMSEHCFRIVKTVVLGTEKRSAEQIKFLLMQPKLVTYRALKLL